MIEDKIRKSVQSLIRTWTMDIDGDVPIQFADELAAGLFASGIYKLCKKYYTLGKKNQKRKAKYRVVRKYKSI